MHQKTNLKDYLTDHLLVGDGAMATYLYGQGVPVGVCYEELNLSRPELIASVHRAYYEAGARFITTNTFGAHRESLARYGLEDQLHEINRVAAEIARKAVGTDAYVVGSVGSIRAGKVSNSPMEGYRSQYREQVEALLDGGVDGILLETFLDVEELLLVLDEIRPLTSLPIIAQLALMEVGRTRDGYSLSEAFQILKESGADILGLNCRMGPAEMFRSIENALVPEDTPLSIFPNAGRLAFTDGEYAYKSSPQYFAENARRFREQGVRLIGGCCGTTPEHIREMAEALNGLKPVERVNPKTDVNANQIRSKIRSIQDKQNKSVNLVDRVKQRHTVIVEFDPPRDLDINKFLKGTEELEKAGADAVTLADNSLAATRMSNMALGAIIKNKFKIEPLLHMACRDRNLIGQQSHLMGLHALDIHHILVVTGDPSRFGDLPGATSVFDLTSFDLIRMVKQLNEGITHSGRLMKQQTRFTVGAAFNPHVRKFEAAVKRLEKKVEAGADFVMTQPVYDEESIIRIYEGTRHIPIPIFIGIMPLTSKRNADFLHNEVPGIKLSDEALERMGRYNGERARQEGLEMAKELIDKAVQYFNGIYIITPFSYYEMSADLTRYVREKTGQNGEAGADISI
ncbi:MAG: bifunctional homocysteine S-methyltransferase/methylenetetrahydrofolate reductase [Bacillaceae bacterium]|nr:bifunctional homocysteine S-methyltransferase/methylenetetrahydrofolate reductase [Bacillaceae bacterium]